MLAAVVACAALPAALQAQGVFGPPGPRLSLARDVEVALARSAAPASVSDSASVWIFTEGRYVLAVAGSNGIECYVGRSWAKALEPQCFDAEGARTILRIHMKTTELAHAGVAADEIRRQAAAALAEGVLSLPRRPAMSWMMSAAQVLYSDNGNEVGAWRPHIMIYQPYLDRSMVGGNDTDPEAGMIVDAGKPMANLMIITAKAIAPKVNQR